MSASAWVVCGVAVGVLAGTVAYVEWTFRRLDRRRAEHRRLVERHEEAPERRLRAVEGGWR